MAVDIKRNLTAELASIVKTAVRENRTDQAEVLPSDILNSVCSVIEAVFIHGLKETRGGSSKSGKKSKSGMPSYPEPNFWPFLEKFTHRNIRAQIGNLNQIKSDIGRARVWIRICLNDRVLENYFNAIIREQQIVRHFYNRGAYLRDSDQCDLLLNYTRALGKLAFKAPLNSSILNEWTPTPLKLAGLLTEKRTPSRGASTVVQMEDVLENDENNDVAVAMSALEYDGLDDAALSDISDIRSESQFSVQSRPVAAYADRRFMFSPGGTSQSGSDLMQDGVGSFGALGRIRPPSELDSIYETTTGENEGEKLDAILSKLTRAKNENTNPFGESNDKNPFVDSGVAGSPPVDVASVPIAHRNGVSDAGLVEAEVNTDMPFDGKTVDDAQKEKNENEHHGPSTSRTASPVVTEPKAIVDEERLRLDQLESSFSPGNSLAARGWSSPAFGPFAGPRSPSTSSIKSAERDLSNSVGNSGGLAALFSSLINTANIPRRHSESDGSGGPHPVAGEEKRNGDKDAPENAAGHESEVKKDAGVNESDSVIASVTNDGTVTATTVALARKSSSSSSLDNFVVVEESQDSLEQAAVQKSFRLSLLTKIADDIGLDVQGYKCHTCTRNIGLPLFGSSRLCSYDGHYYCVECHLNEEKVIPARILYNWDFKTQPVSRASKAFLDHIADQPVIDLQKTNPSLCDVSKALSETKRLRLQLSYAAMYLLTCKESVAEDLRKRVWPKEYLYSAIDQYSVTDLLEVFNGQMQKHLKVVIHYATKHVLQQCRLCAQKGFICELCNDPKIIYAFQLDLTHRCPKCHAVYHAKCIAQKNMVCPKCVRRELYTQQAERSSLNLENVLPLAV